MKTVCQILGGVVLIYMGLLLFLYCMGVVVNKLNGAVEHPKQATWFWECRVHEVYGIPFVPFSDYVGKAKDEAACGSSHDH